MLVANISQSTDITKLPLIVLVNEAEECCFTNLDRYTTNFASIIESCTLLKKKMKMITDLSLKLTQAPSF